MKYTDHVSTKQAPQSQPIPGTTQVENNAGGYAWAVDDWTRLDRFLVLGSEGGTYYVSEQKLTVDNADAVIHCIKQDGPRVVDRVVETSEAGRAPKNDPALFVLAMCAGMGNGQTKRKALEALPRVARIGTHLFHFLDYVQHFRGWGRGLREAVASWYNQKDTDALAYQVVKYRQRDGWSHRDALRLAHPVPPDKSHASLYHWITQGDGDELPQLVIDFSRLQSAKGENGVIQRLHQNSSLSWEMVPTEFLRSPKVWEALLPNMPMTAMIRNLGRMTANGLLKPMSGAVTTVIDKLSNQEVVRKVRVHPIQVLAALITYRNGKGARGNLSWSPVSQIVDALDAAFYSAFGNVEPTNKRLILALDVSGSMTWGEIAGVPGLTPRIGTAAMALVTAAVEPQYHVLAFSHQLVELSISPRQRLDDVVQTISNLPFGGTDCALPMLAAAEKGVDVDGFAVYTDSETWAGKIHPSQALQEYRNKSGIPSKLVVVGMMSNEFSISDPSDSGMLDVVGFDTATPNVISDFMRS